jgi:hypothetical protein
MHPEPPRIGVPRAHCPGQRRRLRVPGGISRIGRRRGDGEPGQLVSDHGSELLRRPDPQVDRDHVRQQPRQRRVIEPGGQHVLLPFPHRLVQRGPALEPGPVPGGVLGGHEHHDRRRLLAVDGRQYLGQVLAP